MAGPSRQSSLRKSLGPRILEALDAVKHDIESNKPGHEDKALISDLLSQLESVDHSVCSRLGSGIYSAIIKTLLNATASHENERAIYLLGAALYYDGIPATKQRTAAKKKDAIGKECLGLLLDYFMDGSRSSGMRQWVGILALQLFQNCDANVQKFELGPEQQRRELGNFLVEEPNEILRIICGQLITVLLTAGVLPEHLWPVDADKQLYTTFPTVALGSRGWNQQFQNYVDNIFDITKQPDSFGQLYFTQNVSLSPQHDFGPEDHNVVVVVDHEIMVIWTGVVADTQSFNHSLEIPLDMIDRMLIKAMSNSQLSGVLNVYIFLKKTDEECYLNCVGTSINQICMVLQQSVIETMRENLQETRPRLEILDADEVVGRQVHQKNTQHTSQTSEALQFNNNEVSVVKYHLDPPRNILSVHPGDPEELGSMRTSKSKTISEAGTPLAPVQGNTDIDEVPPNEISLSRADLEKGNGPVQPSEPKKPVEASTERKRARPLKPKAKPPLRQVQKSATNGKQEQSRSETSRSQTEFFDGLSYEEIDKQVAELAIQFPSTDVSTRRGVVLVSKGDFENAAHLLAKNLLGESSREEISNQKPEKSGPTKKSVPAIQESSKPQQSTKSMGEKQRRAAITAAETVSVQGTAPRRYSLKRTLDSLDNDDERCYEIPPDETQSDSHQAGEKNATVNSGPALPSTAKRTAVMKKTLAETSKTSKGNQKKRQSAPAALGEAKTRRTGQRQAAVAARKKLVEDNQSDDEHQFEEEHDSKSSNPIQKPRKEANAGIIQQLGNGPTNATFPEKGQPTVQQHGPEANIALELSDDLYGASPVRPQTKLTSDCTPPERPFDDLYDATPVKPAMSQAQKKNMSQVDPSHSDLPAQKGQIVGRMAAKMTSLLESLDEPDDIESMSESKAREQHAHNPINLTGLTSEMGLVNDFFSRKTPVVGFHEKGARNQGLPGLVTASNRPATAFMENSMARNTELVGDRKRKRGLAKNGGDNTPPRKRQSLSPCPAYTPMTGNEAYFQSSPPHAVESDNHNSDTCGNSTLPGPTRVSKYGPQRPRVDKNGSPLATRSSQVDRIDKVKKKLLDNDDYEEAHTPRLASLSPDIFGPKLRLSSIPKARPSSSLEDTEFRYIPHKKTRNGHYEVLGTDEVIAPQKALLDPFINKVTSRPMSEFSDRLVAGSSGTIAGSKRVRAMHGDSHRRLDMDTKVLPTNPNQTNGSKRMAATGRVSRRLTEVFMDEDEDTLVQPANGSSSDNCSVPGMTTDTSYGSRSLLEEKSRAWNTAVRPHYANLSATIHRIADEVIIRLADEEDAIKLIANQYKENGEGLVYNAAKKRSEEKAIMTSELDQKEREMVALYADAKGLADRTKHASKKSPLSALDKQWRARWDVVQERMEKG